MAALLARPQWRHRRRRTEVRVMVRWPQERHPGAQKSPADSDSGWQAGALPEDGAGALEHRGRET